MSDQDTKTLKENVEFIEYMVRRYWQAAGASEPHSEAMARAIGFGHRQGKLNQGLGVFEAPILTHMTGNLNIKAEPEIVRSFPYRTLCIRFRHHALIGFCHSGFSLFRNALMPFCASSVILLRVMVCLAWTVVLHSH